MNRERIVDRAAGWVGPAFLVLLLASEIALSLPDEHASAAAVATFYAAHWAVIIGLQVAGFAGSALLALFAWRLRMISPGIAAAGFILAVTTLMPALITLLLAVVADPTRPTTAGTLNQWEPRGDDLLFVGVTLFAATLLPFLGHPRGGSASSPESSPCSACSGSRWNCSAGPAAPSTPSHRSRSWSSSRR